MYKNDCYYAFRKTFFKFCFQERKGNSDSSLQAQSTGEDSNSSDTAMSEHGDRVTPKTEPSDYPLLDEHHPFNTNGGLLDQPRTPTFPGALLGIQGKQLIHSIRGLHFAPHTFLSKESSLFFLYFRTIWTDAGPIRDA